MNSSSTATAPQTGPASRRSDGEDVGEGRAARQGVEKAQAELVVRQEARLDRRGDHPEFQRRFFEEDVGFARAALGLEPVADLEDAVDRERVDGFVGLEVRLPQTDKQRQAEGDDDDDQPQPAEPQALMQVTSDQILGKLTFSMETGLSSACARRAGRSRSDLKPMWTVNGEIARSSHASSRFGLRK